jgi:hypothetical protein
VGARLAPGLAALLVLALGCTPSSGGGDKAPTPAPVLPLPTAGIAGEVVTVYPLTLMAAAEELGWEAALGDRRAALDRVDSIIGALLVERSPEVTWVLPAQLRRAAARAGGLLANPDQMGTALLRAPDLSKIPDPLRSQMRGLNGVAGDRYALVPTALLFVVSPDGGGEAELSIVLADVRSGLIGWRTVAHGRGADPWSAVRAAFKSLTPGLP